MASEKQIAANRANAKRSTGPRTTAGKRRSSKNAYRHGLTKSLQDDSATIAAVEAVTCAIVDAIGGEEDARAFAWAQRELYRIRQFRSRLMSDLVPGTVQPAILRRLAALDRYERLAWTKIRRVMREIPGRNS